MSCQMLVGDTADISGFERFWNVKCPEDLRHFWLSWGSGEGWLRQGGGIPDSDDVIFAQFHSPKDALKNFGLDVLQENMPAGVAPIGSDGASEMIVLVEGQGFGLLNLVHGGIDDVIIVGGSLEEFWQKSLCQSWFPDEGPKN